jgi:hypothetical protein
VLEGAVVPNAASDSKQINKRYLTNQNHILKQLAQFHITKEADNRITHNSAFSAAVNSFAALAVISTLLDVEVRTDAWA